MPKTNTDMLRNKINESGMKISFIAEKCGLTYQGLQNKLKGDNEFRQNEIFQLQNLLRLTNEEAWAIFFASEVD